MAYIYIYVIGLMIKKNKNKILIKTVKENYNRIATSFYS